MDPKIEEQVNNEKLTSKPKSTSYRVAVVFVVLVVGLCVAILIGTENASENQDRIYREQTENYSDETEDASDSSTGGSYNSYSYTSDYSSNDSATSERKHGAYYPETDEYTSPEDFYYNFRDDFMDYDEAEEYYYENGGE